MKFMQTLLLVVVGACAVASVDDVPPYHKYLQDYTQSKTLVNELSTPPETENGPFWDLPSRKRDYIQLVGFVHDITDHLVKDLQHSYDDVYYNILNTSVPHSWTKPQDVLNNLREFIGKADAKTQQVRDLVQKYCGAYRRTKVGDMDCDVLVDLEIKKDLNKYGDEAKALIALGKASAVYVKEPYGPKAHNFDMISFLLTGKSELKELVLLSAKAKFALDPHPIKVR